MINYKKIEIALKNFKNNKPFDYCVVDGFFENKIARSLENDFLDYDSKKWKGYDNPIEKKKLLNDWDAYPPLTYKILMMLNSSLMINLLKKYTQCELFPDMGLHGGGWHIHGMGGNLNPHLDYSIHPKCGLQRKLNMIIYLSEDLKPRSHKGHLGLWSHDSATNQPKELVKEIAPIFNRAVIFDTTQNSWHGMSQKLDLPKGIYRKSLAVYYLTVPPKNIPKNQRAIFSPREDQKNDKRVLEIIKLRQDASNFAKAYYLKK